VSGFSLLLTCDQEDSWHSAVWRGQDTKPTYTGSAWNPPESGKADLQFRRKQSLTASAKNLEAVGQTEMPVFLAVRLLGSVTRRPRAPAFG